jgi:hypothetical protein
MALSEQEKEFINNNLSEAEQKEVKKIVDEMWAVYTLIEKTGIHKPWMDDSERFMGFNFYHSKVLVNHSKALSKLTWGLIGLTIALLVTSIVQIVLLIVLGA